MLVEQLLRHGADPNAKAVALGSGSSEVPGQTALHLAISRSARAHDICYKLLTLGAAPDLPMCFACDEDDEPEWSEEKQEFEGGLAGLTALQVAAMRCTDPDVCASLLARGGDGAALTTLPPELMLAKSLSPLLRVIKGEDGEPVDCAICLSEVYQLTAAWTPCCFKPFHAHCLKQVKACPMCRTAMPTAGTNAPVVDLSRAHAPNPENDPSLPPTHVHDEYDLEAALDAAFFGPRADSGHSVEGRYDSVMGTNFGWRTGGPNSTLYTV